MKLFVRIYHLLHEHLVWVLLSTYVVAVFFPDAGLAFRNLRVVEIHLANGSISLNGPTVLLMFLVLNAGFSIDAKQLTQLISHLRMVLIGLGANTALPILYTLLASFCLRSWHNTDELQNLLVGFAIIGSMPIAGSSTAWSQNAEGNVALSLGLVVASTLLSPLLTPIGFHAISQVTSGDYAEDLLELTGVSTQLFLLVVVVAPSLFGLALHRLTPPNSFRKSVSNVKMINLFVLIALNYSNASVALPTVLSQPDWDFLALVVVVAGILSLVAFACGYWVAKAARAETAERTSLMFALGMNNNGSGLVLASTALADHPNVLLTIVVYNLVQQVAAGVADRWIVSDQKTHMSSNVLPLNLG